MQRVAPPDAHTTWLAWEQVPTNAAKCQAVQLRRAAKRAVEAEDAEVLNEEGRYVLLCSGVVLSIVKTNLVN